MANIERRLQVWTREGLITADQVKAILLFERGRTSSNWLLFSFMSLGAGIVGSGVISLIAANWDAIPDAVKLGSDLFLLLTIALGLWRQRHHEESLSWELMLTFFALACLATIGLIGQIYHAGGTLDQALLLWAALLLPAITLTQRNFLPYTWTFTFLAAGSYRLIMTPIMGPGEDERILLTGYALPLVCALAATALRHWPRAKLFARPFRTYAWSSGITMVLLVDASSMDHIQSWEWHPFMTWTGLILSGGIVAGIVLNRQFPPRVKGLLGSMVALYTITPPIVVSWQLSHWFSAFFTMALFALGAAWLVRERSLRMANALILLLGMRFLILFFTAFGGLLDAGIGLILSGMVILGFVWLWSRWQKKLLLWLERIAPS
ncbi:MAG: DUF2157 domain-containing protein [Magnetococcales bacterium]|nr:DUF2157 domain-containing protein [Magnetococcales bacterium]